MQYRFKAKIHYDGGSTFWPWSRPYSVEVFRDYGKEGSPSYASSPSMFYESGFGTRVYELKSHSFKWVTKKAKWGAEEVIKRELKRDKKRDKSQNWTIEIVVEDKNGKVQAK